MSWTLLVGIVSVLGFALLVIAVRRIELNRMRRAVRDRERARRHGSAVQLQHPVVDLSRCLGCGTCVAVCPEDGVLELVHGQAAVVNGARCQGISACERECPVGAITITLANLEDREDVPVLSEDLEAVGSPGLFLAGEVTAHALIKTAIEHGAAVGAEVAQRLADDAAQNGVNGASQNGKVLDLVVVGAGPAGLACSLEAKRHGLRFVTLEQEDVPGGTVAKYPRRKLVMTRPVELPLHGRLRRTTYEKEELVELWQGIAAREELPIRGGEVFQGLERLDDGTYRVRTASGVYAARHVCIAMGRRGVPNKLGVPGEELPKVSYGLLDAQSYQGRRILVVGGGDSAIEAAVGLAEQPGNEVTLSYRKESFFRIRTANEERLRESVQGGRLRVVYRSEVRAIGSDAVALTVQNGAGPVTRTLPNDEVFVLAGGTPPVDLLRGSGVSFDASQREAAPPPGEQGTGLTRALTIGFGLSFLALAFALWNSDYYMLPTVERPTHPKHDLLRSGMGLGLGLGIAAAVLIVLNLVYLLRRMPGIPLQLGSLRVWMTSHVATGILAFLCATLHGAMAPRNTPGGHALWALVVLLVTGAIGRYFYACVPRAANGRELALAEVKARLGRISEEWDQDAQSFRAFARDEVERVVEARQWSGSFTGRVLALAGVQLDLRRLLARLTSAGREQGVAAAQLRETLELARRAHRTALMVAHYEDLRAALNTWRWVHRWTAALMVLLVVVHVGYALAYGTVFLDGGGGFLDGGER